MLAVESGLVRLDLAEPGAPRPLADVLGLLVADGVAAVSANGVLGDPRGATREHGEALMEVLVADLVSSVADWARRVGADAHPPEIGAR